MSSASSDFSLAEYGVIVKESKTDLQVMQPKKERSQVAGEDFFWYTLITKNCLIPLPIARQTVVIED
jgi:hypothetical protein